MGRVFVPHRLVVWIVLEKDGKVLLQRRLNTEWFDDGWVLPGGHVEAGETPLVTAVRETQEECGVLVDPADFRLVHINYRHRNDGQVVAFIYHADRWQGEVTNAEPEKCAGFTWATLDALPQPILTPHVMALQAGFNQAITCSYYQETV